MSLDLDWDDGQRAVASAVMRLGRDRWDDDAVKSMLEAGVFPDALWRDLAELGLLAVMTPEGEGGACEAVAAFESLGRFGLPGPLVDTLVAGQLLTGSARAAVAAGEEIAVVATRGLVPWPDRAQRIIVADAEGLRLARIVGVPEPVETLGGESWGRAAFETEAADPASDRACAVGETALAALLASAGAELLDRAAEHVRTRSQFGRFLGEFQAVSHPLAEIHMALEAARVLARRAAWALDQASDDAAPRASAARLSARRAALGAVHGVHQVFGAQGITLEGPVYHLSRRVRTWASHPLPTARARVLGWMLEERALEVQA